MSKKAMARGARKSLIAEYKAKARGAPGKSKKPPVKRKKTIVKKIERPMEMTIGESTYSVGDVAWYVDERSHLARPRALQGELTGMYPEDSIEPAVGLRDYETGKHRTIRARLVGWSKKEALTNYAAFVESNKK